MKIQEIYNNYKIMPQLQLHMLRAGGVAKLICDNFQKNIDKQSVVTAALLHDIGNIIKFNLKLFPEVLKPQELNYWEKVKKSFINKYGADEHNATIQILKKIGISNEIIEIINDLEFSKTKKIAKSDDIQKKIVKYSDLRVAPTGVLSLSERLAEARARYTKFASAKWTKEGFNELAKIWIGIEQEIFNQETISPQDITDKKVVHLIPTLREYKINVT